MNALRGVLLLATMTGGISWADNAEQAVEKAHIELWRRFVDEHNLILDEQGLETAEQRG